jgi:hypothetical protein
MEIGGAAFADGDKTVWIVFQANSNPGATTARSLLSLKSGTPLFCELLQTNIVGYQPSVFGVDVVAAPAMEKGIADALDTNAHSYIITATGSAVASWHLEATSKAIVDGGNVGRTLTDLSSIGGRMSSLGAITLGTDIDYYEIGVMGSVIGAADLANLRAYLSSRYGL